MVATLTARLQELVKDAPPVPFMGYLSEYDPEHQSGDNKGYWTPLADP